MNAICIIISILIVVAVLTIVGHGLWLLFAAFARWITSSESPHNHFPDLRTGSRTQSETAEKIQADLKAARRLIDYSQYRGWIEPGQFAALDQQLRALTERALDESQTERPESAVLQAKPRTAQSDAPPTVTRAKASQSHFNQAISSSPESDIQSPSDALSESRRETHPASSLASPPLVHPLEQPEPPTTDADPSSSQWRVKVKQKVAGPIGAGLLRAFMEQTNIRWIEIISGLLIIVCSVGLVISLWNTLSATSRFFPSMVFLVATLAVHAAGQYTLRQWKLRSTSRGILHIGLMLIPLAVLVGILLSQREDQPATLDWSTGAILIVGTLLYGGAAFTAARSLFAARYWLVAVSVVAGGLTLIPIHFLGSSQQLKYTSSALVLIPLVIAGLWSALRLSQRQIRPATFRPRQSRREAMIVLHCIFSAGVPAVFWWMSSNGFSEINQLALALSGLLLAGWASWGWTASLTHLFRTAPSSTGTQSPDTSQSALALQTSWLVIAAWSLATVFSLAVIALVWLTSGNRLQLGGFLLALSVWWLVHGLVCRLSISTLAGFVSATLSTSLFLEWFVADKSIELIRTDWFSFSRVISLYTVALFCGLTGLALLIRHVGFAKPTSESGPQTATQSNRLQMLAFGQLFSGAVVLLGTTVLTAIASLVPWSQPEYGGNWAPTLLIIVGAGFTSAVVIFSSSRPKSLLQSAGDRTDSNAPQGVGPALLVPISQAVLLLGVVCWCQNAPMAADWIEALRPGRSWSVGLGAIGLLWATIASGLRQASPKTTGADEQIESGVSMREHAIEWYGVGSVGAALAASVAYWSHDDRWLLASSLGWILPLVLVLGFISLRQSFWREASLVVAAVWLCTVTIRLGWIYQWWDSLGLSASVALAVLPIVVLLSVYQMILRWPRWVSNWVTARPYWAYHFVLNLCWISLIAAFLPALLGFFESSIQTGIAAEITTQSEVSSASDFIFRGIDLSRSSLIVIALLALSGLTHWWRSEALEWEFILLAAVPTLLAGLFGCNVPAPHSIPATLWILAAILIGVELLPFFGKFLGGQVSTVFAARFKDQPVGSAAGLAYAVEWISMAALILGTSVMLLLLWTVGLPEALRSADPTSQSWTEWWDNWRRLSLWLAPLTLVCATRWICGLLGSLNNLQISQRGYALAVSASLLTANAATNQADTFVLIGARHFTLSVGLTCAATLGLVVLWNWFLLRKLNPRLAFSDGLSKSLKGARWRTAESAGWQLWLGSILAAGVLSSVAGLLVAYYPRRQLAAIGQVGEWSTLLSVCLAIGLGWLLGLRRGLAALTFALLAPILSAGYGSWLVDHPASRIASAANHEPYRLLIGLWLAALVCGVAIRIQYTRRGSALPWLAELGWIAIAVFVGTLSLLSLNVDSHWSFGQLFALATLIGISGEVARQSWRGWAAALLGVIAWMPFVSGAGGGNWLQLPWQSLWGATWVGLVAIASRLTLGSFVFSTHGHSALDSGSKFPRVDRGACLLVSIASIALSGLWVLMQRGQVIAPTTATWIVVGLVSGNLLLAVARLWDGGPSQRGWSVYLALLSATLVIANASCSFMECTRLNAQLIWLSSLLGGMTLLALGWRELCLRRLPPVRTTGLADLTSAERLKAVGRSMAALHTSVALICLLPSLWLVLNIPEVSGRLTATLLPMLGAACIVPLSLERPRAFQRGSVVLLITATLILAWWADLPAAWSLREDAQSWLFAQRALLACTLLGLVYPFIAWRLLVRQSEGVQLWSGTLLTGGWICLGLAGATGAAMVLGNAFGYWGDFPLSVSVAVKLSVLFSWCAIFLRLIQFAARPFGMDQQAELPLRSTCVYVGEATLLLGGISTYQLFPHLFSGILQQWWPLVLFAIAFASAGIGQWLNRSRQQILADPIHRTNLLLPLIPLVGVWWAKSEPSGVAWNDWGNYWLLLATASSLYGLYGWLRNSVLLRGLSAVAALLSFWAYLLSHPNLQFFERPQFWLLPPALGALLFVEWNRAKLDTRAVTMARYLCILIAYLSSAAEVFLSSMQGSLWPPLWLLALSLCGAMAGLILRIRAFLYCGVTFVGVALFGMVWHAAQAIDQVWPWWAFGIATGVGLIVLLGYLEKNRAKVLKYLEQIRSWQP